MRTTFRAHSNPDTVCLTFRRHHAWLSQNRKTYDVLDACSHVGIRPRQEEDDPDHDKELCDRISRYALTEIPDGQNAWLEYLGWIPLDDLVLVDDLGDAFQPGPHLLVTREHPYGFFTHVRPHLRLERLGHTPGRSGDIFSLDRLKRVKHFPEPLPSLPSPSWPGSTTDRD